MVGAIAFTIVLVIFWASPTCIFLNDMKKLNKNLRFYNFSSCIYISCKHILVTYCHHSKFNMRFYCSMVRNSIFCHKIFLSRLVVLKKLKNKLSSNFNYFFRQNDKLGKFDRGRCICSISSYTLVGYSLLGRLLYWKINITIFIFKLLLVYQTFMT